MESFDDKLNKLKEEQENLLIKKNEPLLKNNGWYTRYKNPILTHEHAPLHWRYDFNEESNPFLMERIGINSV